ncbi:MAG: DNA polymerase Y family protein [Granulosicoccus sp.]
MLWLALYFPQLPIDRQQPADGIIDDLDRDSPTERSPDIPRAVVLNEGTRRRILACNTSAVAAGVRAGMALKNAYALVPGLFVSDYDEVAQSEHLEQLTLWALQYSSTVVPEPPDTLLIEIEASLKLFGGLHTLLETIGEQLRDQHIAVHPGIAPTPTAARLFTRAGIRKTIRSSKSFRETLATVNVAHLPLDDFTFKGLRQSGIHTVGELQKIPPAALTRRFGKQCTDILYKLDGRLPDPRTPYRAAETFSQSIDLPLEAPDTQALGFPLKRMLGSLGGFLKARDLGIRHLDIHLYHHRLKPHTVALKFLNATADMSHLLRVATERLGTLTLEAPVTRLCLISAELASMEREGRDLFHKSQSQHQSVEQLLDKLVARLGKEAVYTALPEDDHRPEKAWLTVLLDERRDHQPWPARPLWLLAEPRVLDEPITLHTLPERIENGWWDETDVRRDYFIASNDKGSYYWLYRLRHQPDQWWIHGLFA